ncbi:MAG: hypothetical protein LBT33_09315 [Spirochaetia bacterium]|jgi:hypothetical protein|nr:hypothetical protein [Spirochaetia bacterium]
MSIINDKENGSKGSNIPAEDLEQYGVWVKAGPETVRERSSAKDDFELSDVSDAGTEITEEEEALLGSLEENSRQKDASGEESLDDIFSYGPASKTDEDDFSFDGPAAKSDGDDFSFPDIEDIQGEGEATLDAEAGGDKTAAGEDLFLPEEEALDAGAAGENGDEKIELDFDLDTSDAPPEDSLAGAEGFNDIAAVEKEMTEAEPLPEPSAEPDLSDEAGFSIDSAEPGTEAEPEPELSIEFEPSLDFESVGPGPEPEVPVAGEMPESTLPDEGPEPAAEEEAAAEEPEVFAGNEEKKAAEGKPAAAPSQAQSVEANILSKIVVELASIKSELSELKKELASLRVAGSAEPAAAESHKASAGADSGFFAVDEDEDETIALTGDELDNILSTADITEETGESDVPDDILNFNAEIHRADQQPEAEASDKDLDFAETGAAAKTPEAQEDAAPGDAGEVLLDEGEDFAAGDMEISIEEPEPDAAVPGQELDFGDIMPEDGQEIEIDMADSGSGDQPESFERATDIASAEDTPAVTETIPLTTPEEQAIIEEYNRELDNFGSSDLRPEEEITETLADEEAEIPAGEEEAEIEFDLDSLQQETEEAPQETEIHEEEAAPEAFEEGLPEIEVPAAGEEVPEAPPQDAVVDGVQISGPIREEIRSVLKYMDQLLESLPEDKIQEFAHSEHFDIYRRLFEELELE